MESKAPTRAWSTINRIFPLYFAESSCWLAMYQSRFFLSGSGTFIAPLCSTVVSMTYRITISYLLRSLHWLFLLRLRPARGNRFACALGTLFGGHFRGSLPATLRPGL